MKKTIKNVTIVSLSRGVMGEDFLTHELAIGLERLEKYGLNVKFSENALKGLEYIKLHPEKRAEDLLSAMKDPCCDMILCAIGGDDTYKLLPHLFENGELADAIDREKIFLGFSDTTVNHFMLNKVGMKSFYGQAFLPDVCEIGGEMLPYTESYFRELITTGTIKEIRPSPVWYDTWEDFSVAEIAKKMPEHENCGFTLLQGEGKFEGKIFGGCIDTIYDMFDGERYEDMPDLISKYSIFPEADEWKDKILLLETSEEKMSPEKYRRGLEYLKERKVFDNVKGVLLGKPMDETYMDEYYRIITDVIDNRDLPVVGNVNVGHATPRCIIPFGVHAKVDACRQVIEFD